MSIKDAVILAVGYPILVIPLWIVVLRIWRQGVDIYDTAVPVRVFTPDTARHGYHAFLLPAALSITLSGPVTAAYAWWKSSGESPAWWGDVFAWLFLVCLGLLFLGFWLWAFMRPKILVPPHLRGKPGWVAALRHGREPSGAHDHAGSGEPPAGKR